MSYSVLQAKSDLSGILHGTTLNKVQNINGLVNRTARQLLLDIDPQETKRIVLSSTPIYNRIFDYACPTDLKGNKIIDISPQVLRTEGSYFGQEYNQSFDIGKDTLPNTPGFTILFNTGVKTLRINDPTIPTGIVLDTAEISTGWTAGGTASNVQTDNVNFVSGSGSVSFDLAAGAGSQTGYIEKTLTSAINLTTHLNQAVENFYNFFPTGSAITSVSIRWGTNSTNYYTRTLTTTFEGNAIVTGWNLFGANWLGATVVGSPTVSNINYVRISVTYDGTAQTGVHLDNVVSNLGLYRDIEYYSKYLFRSGTTGAFQEVWTDDSNLINLDTDSYNLFLNLFAFLCVQQVQGLDGLFFDSNFFGQEYMKGRERYTSLYKSEVTKPREQYYRPTKGGYTKYLGIRFR